MIESEGVIKAAILDQQPLWHASHTGLQMQDAFLP